MVKYHLWQTKEHMIFECDLAYNSLVRVKLLHALCLLLLLVLELNS